MIQKKNNTTSNNSVKHAFETRLKRKIAANPKLYLRPLNYASPPLKNDAKGSKRIGFSMTPAGLGVDLKLMMDRGVISSRAAYPNVDTIHKKEEYNSGDNVNGGCQQEKAN